MAAVSVPSELARPAWRAGATADERQLAVIVDEVEAELGALREVRQVPAQRHAVLAVDVRGLDRRPARHALEILDERPAERREVRALVRELAEAEEDFLAAARNEVVAREVGANRLRLGAVPVEQADALHRHVVGEAESDLQHFLRQVGFAQFRARHAQRRHVEMIDGAVDTALDEGAFAPVRHLASRAHVEQVPADVPASVDECVEQADVRAREVLAPVRNRRAGGLAVLDQVVVQQRAAHEEPEVLAAIERKLRNQLVSARDPATLVVEVAVVDVRRAAAAAVGGTDQARVAVLVAPDLAEGNRRVEAPVPAAGGEINRLCGAGREDRGDERGQGSDESLGHVFPQGQDRSEFRAGYNSDPALHCKTRRRINCG